MKTKNKFGVNFIMRSRKDAQGKFPIYARIIVNSNRAEFSLSYSVKENEWSHGNGEALPLNDELINLNQLLSETRKKLCIQFKELSKRTKLITADHVKCAYLGIEPKEKKEKPVKPFATEPEKTLLWLVKEHNLIMKPVLKPGTMKNYFTTEGYVKKFLKKKFADGDIDLKDLSYSFLTHFENYVRTTPLKTNDPCTNNGTMKHIERLKKMVCWAAKNEWMSKNPFAAFSLKFKHTPVEYLELAELHEIEKQIFQDHLRRRVRDIFVFCCYTGLCYADVMALTPTNIVTGNDGFLWIKTVRLKTDIAFDVPLLDKALQILESFKIKKNELPRDTVFPYITNQEINRSLKIIAEVCNISKKLTFHLARHTFATTVTLANDVPIESISKMMGHTKLATTMIYAKVVNTKVSKDMATLQEKLGKPRSHLRAV
jgi:site-specific recombinase XerD